MKFKITPTDYPGIFVREMDTLTSLKCAAVPDGPEQTQTRVGITLLACLTDAKGARLYETEEQVLTDIPAAASTPLYRLCVGLSAVPELAADAEKNSDSQG